jgi:hypothetical protein
MAGILALCAAGSALAQRPQTRDGFWIGFGIGYGSADVKSDSIPAAASRESGPTGFLKLGGALGKKVLLGGEVNAWTKSESGLTLTLGNVSAAAYFYPAPATGFYLKGGVGFANFRVSNGGSATATGFGFLAGLGYDVRVGENISLTPVFNFYFGSDGDLKQNGVTLDSHYKHNVYDFGLGITFH